MPLATVAEELVGMQAQQGPPRLLGVANGGGASVDVNMRGEDADEAEGLEGRLLALLGLLIVTAIATVTAGIMVPLLTGVSPSAVIIILRSM